MCRAYRPTLSAQIIHVQRDLLPREPAAARQNQNQQVTPEIDRDQMKRNEFEARTNISERNETEIQKEIKEKQIRERSKKQNSERQNKNNSFKSVTRLRRAGTSRATPRPPTARPLPPHR